MKTLERGFGVSIGWINERVSSGWYNLIHTRTRDMAADIQTKCVADPQSWRHLRSIINVYSPEDLEQGNLDLDVTDETDNDFEGINRHYYRIMLGASNDSDMRKAVKLKPTKFKPKAATAVRFFDMD